MLYEHQSFATKLKEKKKWNEAKHANNNGNKSSNCLSGWANIYEAKQMITHWEIRSKKKQFKEITKVRNG